MGIIVFNGLSSADYGIKVWQPPTYVIPERDYEVIHVPGRNGDLLLDKDSYKNTTRSYVVSFGKSDRNDFTLLANSLSEWLHSCSGYARLEDSYEPDYYRIAAYRETNNITNVYHQAGQATIKFECKPQRFLKSGDRIIKFLKQTTPRPPRPRQTHGYLDNPTFFESRPIIKVYGSGNGNIKIGQYTVEIESINNYIIIDSEALDTYSFDEKGNVINCNSNITLNGNFPRLKKGRNEIIFSGGITALEVQPKWWTI